MTTPDDFAAAILEVLGRVAVGERARAASCMIGTLAGELAAVDGRETAGLLYALADHVATHPAAVQ